MIYGLCAVAIKYLSQFSGMRSITSLVLQILACCEQFFKNLCSDREIFEISYANILRSFAIDCDQWNKWI